LGISQKNTKTYYSEKVIRESIKRLVGVLSAGLKMGASTGRKVPDRLVRRKVDRHRFEGGNNLMEMIRGKREEREC